MKESTVLAIIAMVCLTFIEIAALINGVNGLLMGGIMTLIGGLGGYQFKDLRTKRKK